jgi:hypothetical protein
MANAVTPWTSTRVLVLALARGAIACAASGLAFGPALAVPVPPPTHEAPTIPAAHDPVPPSARAALERARICWEAVDLACAARELTLARATLSDLEPAERLEVLRLSAELALAGDDREAARARCKDLLELEPRFAPTTWPEAWRTVLDEARRLLPDRLPPRITLDPPRSVPARKPVTLAVKVTDPSGAGRCELVLPATPPATPEALPAELRLPLATRDGETFELILPAERVRPPAVLFHVEAWDRAGNGPTRWPEVGSHALPVDAPPTVATPPLTERWWFWTAIGAVVVGGAVALALALDDAPAAAPGSSGDLAVTIELP